MIRYLTAFAVTLLVETPIVVAVLPRSVPVWRRVAASITATGLTHPILWFVLRGLFPSYLAYVTISEIGIVLVEAVILRLWAGRGTGRQSFAASALANGSSFLVGVLIRALF